jgi:SpoVK/Ycf46/Vps4 family AAA+-type ATPase
MGEGETCGVLHCAGNLECHRLKTKTEEFVVGVLIGTKTEAEAESCLSRHLTWWGNPYKSFEVVRSGVQSFGGKPFASAVIRLPRRAGLGGAETNEKYIPPQKAESLIQDLATQSKWAFAKGLCPVFLPGAATISVHGERAEAFCLFVQEAAGEEINASIKSIGTFVYWALSGIDAWKTKTLPPISRWVKDTPREISALLEKCLAGRSAALDGFSDVVPVVDHGVSPTEKMMPVPFRKKGLAKVAGMEKLKALLKEEVIEPLRNPEPFRRYGLSIPNGVLLYGPPGCGKTFIAKQLAEEIDFYFLEIIPSEIASPYIHDSVIKIRDVFSRAEQNAPSLLFIDEFEAMVPFRSELGGAQQYKSEEVNEFLVQLNNCAAKRIFIIAATNEPEKIDSAIQRTGRLDKIIYVPPPDLVARLELLQMCLSGRPHKDVNVSKFAGLLEGYSSSDIRNFVDDASRMALKAGQPIGDAHFKESLKRNPSSLTEEMISRYAGMQQRGI